MEKSNQNFKHEKIREREWMRDEGIPHGLHLKEENSGNILRIWYIYLCMYPKVKYFREKKKLENKCLKLGCACKFEKQQEAQVVEAERAREDIRKAKEITALKAFDFYSTLNSKT